MQIRQKIKYAAVFALAVAALAARATAQETESSFEITLSSPQQVQDFIKNNEKFFYVKDSSSLFFTQEYYNLYSYYTEEYSKRFFPSTPGVSCSTSFITYDGKYIKPQDVEKIRINKKYINEGFRNLKRKFLVYFVTFYGKGWFESRTAKIYIHTMRKRGGKPVDCYLPPDPKKHFLERPALGAKIENQSFTYPSSLYIPKDALAQNIDKEKVTHEINKNLTAAISDNNTGSAKIQKMKQQMDTAFI
jgi:hypothetical protein